jgi:hypothetical protein
MYIYTGARLHVPEISPQAESLNHQSCHSQLPPILVLKLLDFITAAGWRRRRAARTVVPSPVASAKPSHTTCHTVVFLMAELNARSTTRHLAVV